MSTRASASQVLTYVVAARAIGARSARIIARHIMPNCLAIYLILATYYLGFPIILEASLSFLGVGVPPWDSGSWSWKKTRTDERPVVARTERDGNEIADVLPVTEVKRYLASLPKGLFELPRGSGSS